jgi:hypothetical protein
VIHRGDCLACWRLKQCRETSVEKVLAGYTCSLFEPVAEPVAHARWDAMQKYGEQPAVKAMLPLTTTDEGEDEDA